MTAENTLREEVVELRSDLKSHMKIEEIVQKNQEAIQMNQLNLLSEIRADIKDQRTIIQENREHFDSRIDSCSEDLKQEMKEEYMTRAQIMVMKEESVIFHTERRRDEMKEAKTEILSTVADKDKVIVHQLVQLRSIVYWAITTAATAVGGMIVAIVMFFKEGS